MKPRLITAAATAVGIATAIGFTAALSSDADAQELERTPQQGKCTLVQIWPILPPFGGIPQSSLQGVCANAVPHDFNPPPPPFPFLDPAER